MNNTVAVANRNKVLYVDTTGDEFAVFLLENGREKQKTRWTTFQKACKNLEKIAKKEL